MVLVDDFGRELNTSFLCCVCVCLCMFVCVRSGVFGAESRRGMPKGGTRTEFYYRWTRQQWLNSTSLLCNIQLPEINNVLRNSGRDKCAITWFFTMSWVPLIS